MTDTEAISEITDYPQDRRDRIVPSPGLARLGADGPGRIRLEHGHTPWLLTRYADVRAALAQSATSADVTDPDLPRVGPLIPGPNLMSFLKMDEPDHGRLRRMVTAEFTHRRVQALRPRIEAQVEGLLDELADREPPLDLLREYAMAVPSRVVSELFGIPAGDRAMVQSVSETIASSTADPADAAQAFGRLTAYLDQLTARYEAEPEDNLLGRVAERYVAPGELSHEEFVAMARLLVVAGHETTAQMIALSVLALLAAPAELAKLRADPGLWSGAVDELLRFLSITQVGVVRLVTGDVEIGGCPMGRGDGFEVSLPAANHDPSVFPEPGRLDVERDASAHLAFGHGVHQCLGRSLAKAELETALRGLLTRFPGLRLAVGEDEIGYRTRHDFVFGVHELPVTW
ncbi:hypothetical protein SAMN05443665_104065 [Actinomadura meyerae]|jgi:cytochrome P450|uniref:Cytochrome P450 n=1 Tax=Actinomadura meyerae TaxID=240840 RepID=A0A239NH03_9ACTN|nr:cytochrome P450 [Actinomadura meyerae]SNT53704.1 hypothetical protein SAMN05443665_104065 [Actinomadura meyerae]